MTYEALTLIIEHYNITMNVSPMMYHTMIHVDSEKVQSSLLLGPSKYLPQSSESYGSSLVQNTLSPAAQCYEQPQCDEECSDQNVSLTLTEAAPT